MRKNILLLAVFCLLLLSLAACSKSGNSGLHAASPVTANSPQTVTTSEANLSGQKLNIMLARTETEKAKGLMFFESLPENAGMLFVYNTPRVMSFWMKNTMIPLDLVFFSENLEITEWIEGMVPGYGKTDASLPRYVSKLPAQYALELNAGSIARLGLKKGDRLEIPLTLLYSD